MNGWLLAFLIVLFLIFLIYFILPLILGVALLNTISDTVKAVSSSTQCNGYTLNDGTCVNTCPINSVTDNVNKKCICPNYYLTDSSCVESCPLGTAAGVSRVCNCIDPTKVYDLVTGSCLPSCGQEYTNINGICKKLI